MLKKTTDLQKASLFTVLAFAFIVLGSLNLPKAIDVGQLMYVPLVAVILTMLATGELFTKKAWASLGFHRFKWKPFLVGFTLPIIAVIIGYVIIWSTGLAEFKVPEEAEGKLLLVLGMAVVSLVTYSLTQVLGEEIGWRGYLLPRLQEIGVQKALVLSALIWGVFHIPAILFTGQYHSDTNLFVYIPLFLINILFVGIFVGYLRINSGSIWPAIIAHSVHNIVWAFCRSFTVNPDPIVQYLTGDVGVFSIVFYVIVFLFIRKKIGVTGTIHSISN